jgi:hypothetical protein
MNQDDRGEKAFAVGDIRVESETEVAGASVFNVFQTFSMPGGDEERVQKGNEVSVSTHGLNF